MAIKTRQDQYGVDINAETTEILETSRLVSKLTGYPVQYNKAVVGKNAFSHESGIHQHGYLRNSMTYEIMTPGSVGQEAKIVLGKHSGRAGFKDALDKLLILHADHELLIQVLILLKNLQIEKVKLLKMNCVQLLDKLKHHHQKLSLCQFL